jgi:hypothetical protein
MTNAGSPLEGHTLTNRDVQVKLVWLRISLLKTALNLQTIYARGSNCSVHISG